MADDKRELRKESYRIAHDLIHHDDIERAAEILADYQKRFAESDDLFLKRGLPLLFVLDLIQNCRRRQVRRVSNFIAEHYLCDSVTYLQIVKRYELMMFLKFGDTESATRCMKQFLADASMR